MPNQWIKISEQLPKEGTLIALWADYFAKPEVRRVDARLLKGDWSNSPHVWYPIPEPPKPRK